MCRSLACVVYCCAASRLAGDAECVYALAIEIACLHCFMPLNSTYCSRRRLDSMHTDL